MKNFVHYTDAQQFYDRVESFLLDNEAENNLMVGIASTLVDDPTRYSDEAPFMSVVEDGEAVKCVIIRTPPFNVLLSYMQVGDDELTDIISAAVRGLRESYDTLPGVTAIVPFGEHFAKAWQAETGQAFKVEMPQRIYRLEQVKPPEGVPGQLRPATQADRGLMLKWLAAFNEEIFGEKREEQAGRTIDRALQFRDMGIYLWEDGGEVVSMGANAGPTQNGARVGAIYTPPEQRRKGYASATTAAVSQIILDGGKNFCFLFTDLDNPTTNHIYQEIGYVPVCDVAMYHFSD